MYDIKAVRARQIFDSRSIPTIECEVKTGFGRFTASVPSGTSTGAREAVELRDGGGELAGNSVHHAVQNVNEILSVVAKGKDCREQKEIDDLLIAEDGTENKSKLGANALLAVSLAVARSGAVASNKELFNYLADMVGKKPIIPVPALNVINGGAHASNELPFQEYQILPLKFKSFNEALTAGVEVYQKLKENLLKKYGKSAINVGFEGGFAPQVSKIETPLDEISKALESTNHVDEFALAMDVAANAFSKHQDDGKITYAVEGHTLTSEQLIAEYGELIKAYRIVSIEDPFDETHLSAWEEFNKKFGKRLQIVADDLTVSQESIVSEMIENKRANALLLKVNQVGTLSGALDSAKLALSSNWNVQVGNRSGETNDCFIADLAIGLGCGQMKSGAPCRGERLAKYNHLLRLEEEFSLAYSGKKSFPNFE
ncbi:MAG: phosphopyruvate hydratase [Candidatus Diapherotrites archaeon]|jgi:enolase|nr:phosphopyruvate hydratase [Candidatus Diapherotrites archaeon]MBT4597226.1 phosphopyruvate hydratase [Candidatus Diapherotrites archaeon]